MKRTLVIASSVLALALVALALLPVIFKDDLLQRVKNEASATLNANIDFGDVDISIFHSFPGLTLSVDDVKVTGKSAFEGLPLADIASVEITVDVMSVLGGGTVAVESFVLRGPTLHVIILEDGQANYDITQPSPGDEPEAASEGDGAFSLALKHYAIEGGALIYDDRPGELYAELGGLNHSGRGDFTEDVFVLEMVTAIESMTVKSGGVVYFDKTRVDADTKLEVNLPESRYAFKENKLSLNGLALGFEGWVAMPGEAIDMDLSFEAKETSFKQILTLVPPVYMADMAGVKAEGELAMTGSAKGAYLGETLPAFGVALKVNDGMFQYPDLPKAARNIQMDIAIDNPGGTDDATVVDIRRGHLELGSDPIDLAMRISTPVSDPAVKGMIKASLDLANLKDVMPLEEGESYGGRLSADVALRGRLSSIDNERYEDVEASGAVRLKDIRYASADLPYGVEVSDARFDFTPAALAVPSFNARLGKSDVQLTGRVANYLAYALRGDALTGSFVMTSTLMDLDELGGGSEASEGESEGGESGGSGEAVLVPDSLDLTLSARIGTLRYDGMEMKQAIGSLRIKGGEMHLDEFKMQMMGGTLGVNGVYSTTNPAQPKVDLGLDISRFDLPQTYATFGSVQKLAPIVESATGDFSTKMRFNALFDSQMNPVLTTLKGEGKVTTHNVALKTTGVLSEVASKLTLKELQAIALNNIGIKFEFNDGRVEVDPFDFKAGDIKVKAQGSHGIDQSLDYDLDLDVPTAAMGSAASAAGGLLAPLGASVPQRVNVDVHIGGTVTDPKIQVAMKDLAAGVKDQLKGAAEAQLEQAQALVEQRAGEVKGEVEARLKAEAEAIRKEAAKQAQVIRDQAAKAGKEVQKSAYASADKLVEEAKNPIAKAAAKETAKRMKKEADDTAKQIVAKGDKEAKALLDAAEERIKALK